MGAKSGGIIHWYFETLKGKKAQGYVNGFGAAIVVLGALAKILHLPGGSAVIGAGLITEAILFVLGAFEPVHMPLDWTKAYPQIQHPEEAALHGHADEEADGEIDMHVEPTPAPAPAVVQAAPTQVVAVQSEPTGIVQKLDEILSQANIDAELLSNFRESLYDFSMNTKKFSDAVDIVDTQQDYSQNLAKASSKVEELNSLFDDQISMSKHQAETSEKFLSSLNHSVELQSNIKEELSDLVSNISSLNNVYGGMLSTLED